MPIGPSARCPERPVERISFLREFPRRSTSHRRPQGVGREAFYVGVEGRRRGRRAVSSRPRRLPLPAWNHLGIVVWAGRVLLDLPGSLRKGAAEWATHRSRAAFHGKDRGGRAHGGRPLSSAWRGWDEVHGSRADSSCPGAPSWRRLAKSTRGLLYFRSGRAGVLACDLRVQECGRAQKRPARETPSFPSFSSHFLTPPPNTCILTLSSNSSLPFTPSSIIARIPHGSSSSSYIHLTPMFLPLPLASSTFPASHILPSVTPPPPPTSFLPHPPPPPHTPPPPPFATPFFF